MHTHFTMEAQFTFQFTYWEVFMRLGLTRDSRKNPRPTSGQNLKSSKTNGSFNDYTTEDEFTQNYMNRFFLNNLL